IARPRLLHGDIHFENAVPGLLSIEPTRYGAVRNVGNGLVLITGVSRGGRHADEFSFLLEHVTTRFDPRSGLDFILDRLEREREGRTLDDIRRELQSQEGRWSGIFRPDDLNRHSPLPLAPGETILVGGLFFPQAEGTRDAFIQFETNAPRGQSRFITLWAFGQAVASQGDGDLIPDSLMFKYPNWTRRALLTSYGQTPWLITALRLEDPNLGFRFEVVPPTGGFHPTNNGAYQIDSGGYLEIRIRFVPPVSGQYEAQTKLIAETNAGRR